MLSSYAPRIVRWIAYSNGPVFEPSAEVMRPFPVGVRSAGNDTTAGEKISAPSLDNCFSVCGAGVGLVSTTWPRTGQTAAVQASKIKNAQRYAVALDRHPIESPLFAARSVPNNPRLRQSNNFSDRALPASGELDDFAET